VGIAAALRAANPLPPGQALTAAASEAAYGPPANEPVQGGEAKTDPSFFAEIAGESVIRGEAAAAAKPEMPAGEPKVGASPLVESTKPAEPADPMTADAYIVGDIDSGRIYIEKNSSAVLPFASMSKLITALAATNEHPPDHLVEITQVNTEVPPDQSGLKAGEKFTVAELLYPLLLNSSNVAAEALASSVDRANFISAMSGYAWEIGMPGSFFADPTGLSPANAGTARGFFDMARYLYKNRPDILAITRTPRVTTASTTLHAAHEFANIHPFVNDPRFLGGKTGYTGK